MNKDEFIELAKKIEVFIQSDGDYKGDIICGNFATRFDKLYNVIYPKCECDWNNAARKNLKGEECLTCLKTI